MTDDFQVDEISELGDKENETFNLTLEQYLLRTLGPKHLALSTVIPLTVIYVLIFVTGVFGNVSVCAVIIKNASLHTATNYYLFSLAVSDLTLLTLGLPNDLSVYWQQYPWALGKGLCKVRALVSEMVSYTSVLTIVAFSMERYLAICHPLHHYAMSGLKRAVKIIGVLWAVSLVGATPFAVFTTVNYLDYPPGSGQKVPESGFCAMLSTNIPPSWPIYEMSSLLFFLLPMLVILILYIRMGIAIRERGTDNSLKRVEGLIHKRRHSSSRKTIIRMLAAVVIAFFLCWAPFHAQRLLYLYANNSPNFPEINEWMYHIAGIFYYISSTVNPILYNVMSAKYRLAFKKTLFGFMSSKKYSSDSRRFDSLQRFDQYSASLSRNKMFDRSPITDTGSESINGGTGSPVQLERTVDGVNRLVRTNNNDKTLNNNKNNNGRNHHKNRSRQKRESPNGQNAKSVGREPGKNACGVVVVITPASNKIYKM